MKFDIIEIISEAGFCLKKGFLPSKFLPLGEKYWTLTCSQHSQCLQVQFFLEVIVM